MSPLADFEMHSKITIPPYIPPNISLCGQAHNWPENYM